MCGTMGFSFSKGNLRVGKVGASMRDGKEELPEREKEKDSENAFESSVN